MNALFREEVSEMAKRYYNVCPLCNGNLDLGERCTCTQEKKQENAKLQSMYRAGRGGQLQFCFSEVQSREKVIV